MNNSAPGSERTFISFFGAVNAGKSSVVNRFINQPLSIVSEKAGTTTDPVIKSMELLPIGPVSVCDTAGLDDNTELGELRLEKTYEILRKTDIAVLVVDSSKGLSDCDSALVEKFKQAKIPYIICYNKSDLSSVKLTGGNEISVSAVTGEGIEALKNMVASFADKGEKVIVADLVEPGKYVVLVTPIDEAAPKGRLILPQQLVLRELLDADVPVIVTKETELVKALDGLKEKPQAVITDSQVFEYVRTVVPEDVYLTSFSILMQRYKGVLGASLDGVGMLDKLKDHDKVLICDGCTHHRQCNDIGTVKLPAWIRKYTGKELDFNFTQGGQYPKELKEYALIVHCGGCMLNEREMLFRMKTAVSAGVPFTNYGLVIAKINGILDRSVRILKKRQENK